MKSSVDSVCSYAFLKVTQMTKFISTIVLIVLLTVSNIFAGVDTTYFYNSDEFPSVCFFPIDKAYWDGYKVTVKDWRKLDERQKTKFVLEGIKEIENLKFILIRCVKERDVADIVDSLNKTTQILSLGGSKSEVIWILRSTLEMKGCF